MGGKSSKQKKSSKNRSTSINVTHAIEEGPNPGKKLNKKDKKKSPKKGANCKPRHDSIASTEHVHECSKAHKSISFEENTAGGLSAEPKQVYRKKSACPSCDARDVILEQLKARRETDKSLRYSDFNRVVRQSRIHDLDTGVAEIPLDGVPEPLPHTICFVCGVYTGSVTHTCRVCLHVYHAGCLHKIGHEMTAHAVQLSQRGVWSCHQCSDISRLLTREETDQVSAFLKELNINQDVISAEDYVIYKDKMAQALGKAVAPDNRPGWLGDFWSAVRGGDSPLLDWGQFLQLETVAILAIRCKDSLVHLMTDAEFALARTTYKGMVAGEGQAVAGDVKEAIAGVYSKYSDSQPKEDGIPVNPADVNRSIDWTEFLRLIAVHMVAVRKIPKGMPSDEPSYTLSKSLDSVDDEDYKTCDSDFDPLAVSRDDAMNDGGGGDEADNSMSMLEEISKQFDADGVMKNSGRDVSDQAAAGEPEDDVSDDVTGDVVVDEAGSARSARQAWLNKPNLRNHPNLTTIADEPETRPSTTEEIVNYRRSEILVRPSTEEGRSPRRALSQKIAVTPGYGLVEKLRSNDWSC